MENVPAEINTDMITQAPESGIFLDVQLFEHCQRVATMLSKSSMVPKDFQNNVGNVMIALNLASRTQLDPFLIMSKMYVIHGKPAIESQLAIAMINSSGLFGPLEYKMFGEGDNLTCVACAVRRKDGDVAEGPPVSIKMAKDDGWYGKTGSKWKSLPDMMLRYRAAMYFGRVHCPEVLLGMLSADEAMDITSHQVNGVDASTSLKDKLKAVEQKPAIVAEKEPELNPLHNTPEWKEWNEVKIEFPEESTQVVTANGEPINPDQCLQAVKMVGGIVDSQNAEAS